MIEEYVYKAGVERAKIIDETLWSILRTRRPKTAVVLNALGWHWLWKVAGIQLKRCYLGDWYEEYNVYQYGDLLATFTLKQSLTVS